MPGLGGVARSAYVGIARAARTVAHRTGALGALDRARGRKPHGAAAHVRSLMAIYDVDDMVALDTPWWTYRAIAAADAHLAAKAGMARVFEYGSGASSIWLAARASHVSSVEHDAEFARVVAGLLTDRDLTGSVDLLVVPPVASPQPAVPSGKRDEQGRDYADYVDAIDRVDGEFDLVVVDGRARVACLAKALSRLAPDGVVLFDDSRRARYAAGLAADGLDVTRYRGWAPSLPYPSETSFVRPASGGAAG